MSDKIENDRWRELADLLGLPPDEAKQAPVPPPAPPPPLFHQPAEPEPREPEMPAFNSEPVAEDSFEPAAYEEIEVTETHFQAELLNELAANEPVGPAGEGDEGTPQEPRRRGRRRGRRGQKNDGPDRDNREPRERAASPGDVAPPREEPVSEDQERAERDENGEEERGDRGRSRRREFAEAQPRDFEEDEVLETEGAAHPVPEEDDDEEIDKLTDWNVPSWTELIGSLYRPER